MTREQPTLKGLMESTTLDVIDPSQIGQRNISDDIDAILKDLDASSDDPLYKVTCLQLIADLAASKEAIEILEARKVPDKLISILDENDPLIIPHALKLFHRISPLDIEIKYPRVLNKLCDYCQSEDRQLLDYAIDLIASIGSRGFLCRQVLDRLPDFKHKCLPQLGSTIISSDPLMKTHTLDCLRDLLFISEDDPKVETSQLSETFYHQTIPGELRMTTQILALCRIPIMEIRVRAMQVVAAVAGEHWAQKEFAVHPNFPRWIVDRSSESCKETKEAKFKILKTIIESKTAARTFSGEDYLKMRADSKMGPYHVGIAEEMMDTQQAS